MSALFSLQGQRALVTGASRGLGKAIAQALAQAGALVICSSSQLDGANKTVAEIQAQGGQAAALAADEGAGPDVRRSVAALCQAEQL